MLESPLVLVPFFCIACHVLLTTTSSLWETRKMSTTAPITPTVARIVHYRLTEADCAQISRRRTTKETIALQLSLHTWPAGAQAHIGSPVTAGDTLPLVITKVNQDGTINGQVLLDGNDTLWAQNIHVGAHNGAYAWPTRA